VEVRVCQIEGVVAALAFTAGRIFPFAEKCLGKPQREPLFSDPSRTVKEETRGESAGTKASRQTFLQVFVPEEAGKRHVEIWHVS